MQNLIKELQLKITTMKQNGNGIDLSDETLDDLYSIFPFNKFEFIIAHLIATQTLNLQEYLDIRNAYYNAINIFICLKSPPHEPLVKLGHKGI